MIARVGAVDPAAHQLGGERHPDRIAEALAERSGRGFDARREPVLGMPGRARAPLAEVLDVVERQVVAGQVQDRVEQHRSVPAREHEAIAVRPLRRLGHVAQVPGEQLDRDSRERHRRAGMAAVGFLHGVDGKEAHGLHRVDERVRGAIRTLGHRLFCFAYYRGAPVRSSIAVGSLESRFSGGCARLQHCDRQSFG